MLIPVFVFIAPHMYQAYKIANEYQDPSALFLVIIYVVRYIAWLLGCFFMLLKLIEKRLLDLIFGKVIRPL